MDIIEAFLARIIHEGSSRKPGDGKRDGMRVRHDSRMTADKEFFHIRNTDVQIGNMVNRRLMEMNHAKAIAVVSGFRREILCAVVGAILG